MSVRDRFRQTLPADVELPASIQSETYTWNSDEFATELMTTLLTAFICEGGSVSSASRCAFTNERRLYLSFGRQKGHTQAGLDFIRLHPELNFMYIAPTYQWIQNTRGRFPSLSNIYMTSVGGAQEGCRGRRFDAVILDTSLYGDRSRVPLIPELQSTGAKVVVLCSDLMENYNFKARELIDVSF